MLSIQAVRSNDCERQAHGNRLSAPGVFVREGAFFVKNLVDDDEKAQAYRLRHRIFSEELKWVPRSETLMEMDEYDKHACFFGVFDGYNRLVAFLRLILPTDRFMIEREFGFLVGPSHEIRKAGDTGEVSRLCTLPEARESRVSGNFGIYGITMLLYKGLYLWSVRNGIRYLYLVVDRTVYRLFRAKGFPCEAIGEPVRMADGCVAMAAVLDLRNGESMNRERRPAMMSWFSQYGSAPTP